MKAHIEKKQKSRFLIIFELYKMIDTNGPKNIDAQSVSFGKLSASLGFDLVERMEVKLYLQLEEYIFIGIDEDKIAITHKGFKMVENILTNPDNRNSNFPSLKEMGF